MKQTDLIRGVNAQGATSDNFVARVVAPCAFTPL